MHSNLITLLYLDPGSGSFILQMVIAAAVGGAFAVKVYWKKIKKFFSGKKGIEEPTDLNDEPGVEQNEHDDQK
ncbi:MAG: hypothetical protein ABFD14_08675 [Anaerolineaceae bacterium]|jgi:hypothetical protein